MSNPRNYTEKTLKRLYGLSGNQCAFTGCGRTLVNEDNAANSNICHIEAAKLGGQRYNPNMTDTERADYHNLILLCQSHHKVTDDVKIYTIDKLKTMKAEHEAMIQRRLFSEKPLNTRPSLLADIVKYLGKINFDDDAVDAVVRPFNIEDKINHNQVIRYRPVIEQHAVYAVKLQKIYAEFEREGNGSMNKVLRNIATIYAKQKGEILGADLSLKSIQKNADVLIEAVMSKLRERLELSPNNAPTIQYDEDVEFWLWIILVDAFMRCKILEEPQ